MAKPFHSFWLFFPAAAIWAIMVVPLSIHAVLSGSGWPPGLLGPGHGHELIFGFALALIAGYTLGPQPWRVLAPLFLLWLVARLCWTLAPDSLISQLLSPAFALLLARYAVPRFRAAKKWRNRIAGPLILALCLLSVVFWIAAEAPANLKLLLPDTRRVMLAAIVGLLLLMTFMGGRIIAPAVAGTLEKRGIPLQARVQPRIEGSLLVILPAAVILAFMPVADPVTGFLLVLAAILILTRTARWKLWHCMKRPDLLVLALGYIWLAVGAGITGVRLLQAADPLPALHVITIGALGTLSISVMLRLAWQRARRAFPPAWQVLGTAGAIAMAVLARLHAGSIPFAHPAALWISALCWSMAYGLVAIQLVALFRHSQQRRK
ncbi:NnrS family protein [Marinobacter orientalis]|uniref:NnrS family protein n=1 Tax=Marinobacter orientalis TaxID=1928859 RepID=A0A7Y0NIN9_9GAMM|nr:NnrS family protein [Marinobacter orientalis]NMT62140.1 NnrS family protein [Marinobacter orientalis]TGX50858.1 NnrS family protein [Marinobacter orientalis]